MCTWDSRYKSAFLGRFCVGQNKHWVLLQLAIQATIAFRITYILLVELRCQKSDVMNVSSIMPVLLQFVQHQFGQLHVLMDDANRTARE